MPGFQTIGATANTRGSADIAALSRAAAALTSRQSRVNAATIEPHPIADALSAHLRHPDRLWNHHKMLATVGRPTASEPEAGWRVN